MTGQKGVTIIVNRKFVDKRTKDVRNVGDVLSVSRARYNEIRKADMTLVQLFDEKGDQAEDEKPDGAEADGRGSE